MKIIKICIPVLLLIFAFQQIGAETVTTAETVSKTKDGIKWYALDEALPMAKEQKKFIFIDFYTTWCHYCKKMDKEVFNKAEIINLLNNDFIAVKVNGDSKKVLEIDGYKITENELAKKEFKVSGYPTFWWLTPSGKKLHTQSGFAPADFWISALTQIKDLELDSLGNAIQPTEKK